jgi:biopolymer transport protein ExbB/TolQ
MSSFNVGFKDVLLSGSFTLAPLILLSMYSLALIWERRNFYKKSFAGLRPFLDRLRHNINSGELKEALTLCKQHPGPSANVVLATLVGPSAKEERRKAAERVLEKQLAALERGLPALGTIGSVAPFIGLFGTVLGVMRAFRDLAGAAGAGPGVVAIGISEALVATAAGLFVAIPAVVAYNYFTTQANRFVDELRWISDEILERLTEKTHG